jgi:hypothetical protein
VEREDVGKVRGDGRFVAGETPMTTGKVKSVTSKPVRQFIVAVPGPPAVDVAFNIDVGADDFAVALAAYTKGSDVDVTGTPPTCTGVTAR